MQVKNTGPHVSTIHSHLQAHQELVQGSIKYISCAQGSHALTLYFIEPWTSSWWACRWLWI